ncbi:MAG TPA: hypothetical protein VE078_00950, partial [Thermoanaerobaculia bacterium]|nr:hypothetical protein [Thermoanaerobaculia bacterium]
DVEGILAIIFIFGGGSLFLLAVSPVGKAFADRLRHGPQPGGPGEPDPGVLAELEQLRSDVTELQERVEFAERLLARKSGAELPPGGERS